MDIRAAPAESSESVVRPKLEPPARFRFAALRAQIAGGHRAQVSAVASSDRRFCVQPLSAGLSAREKFLLDLNGYLVRVPVSWALTKGEVSGSCGLCRWLKISSRWRK